MKLMLPSKQYQDLKQEFRETGKVCGEEFAVMVARFKGGKVPVEVDMSNETDLNIDCSNTEVHVMIPKAIEPLGLAGDPKLSCEAKDVGNKPISRISSTLKSIADDDFEKNLECELLNNKNNK